MGLLFRRGRKDDKSAAEEHYTRGQWAQALEAYLRVASREPDNAQVLRRVADLQAKAGRRAEAAAAYRKLAELYARGGFLPQAIAVQKVLLRVDPAAGEVAGVLAGLYSRRGTGSALPGVARRPLPEISLFADLGPGEVAQIIEKLVPRSLGMGETLFREGDPGDSLFFVASGAVQVCRGGVTLAELGEGAVFGEGAFFSRERRSAEVTAVGPAELLEMRREDADALVARHPGVADALAAFYRRRVLDRVLAASPVFRLLREEERRRLADLFRDVGVSPGDVVVREGDTDRSLYLVKRGRFLVTALAPGTGKPLLLAELGPGSLFGEVALVSGAPRTASVTAATEGVVLAVPEAEAAPVLERNPALREALERLRDERAAATIAQILQGDT
ncbi:MAG: cyclic nucleotide-binding domain-containing protein [Deferrisomatales bacterium]